MNRRNLLGKSILSASVIPLINSASFAATPRQAEGPYHPMNLDADLRSLGKGKIQANGRQISVAGQIFDSSTGQAIPKVLIEIWQADSNGKYSHPGDPLNVKPDPNFQFWGRAYTNDLGYFIFYSVKPGSYKIDDDWTRPPHIHLNFNKRGYHSLTTQLYFLGNQYNETDRVLQKLSKEDQQKLIVNFFDSGDGSGLQAGVFNVELDPV